MVAHIFTLLSIVKRNEPCLNFLQISLLCSKAPSDTPYTSIKVTFFLASLAPSLIIQIDFLMTLLIRCILTNHFLFITFISNKKLATKKNISPASMHCSLHSLGIWENRSVYNEMPSCLLKTRLSQSFTFQRKRCMHEIAMGRCCCDPQCSIAIRCCHF